MSLNIHQLIVDISADINKIKAFGLSENLKVYTIYKQLYDRIRGLNTLDIPNEAIYTYYKDYIKYELQTKITLDQLMIGDVLPCYRSYYTVTRELKTWSEFLQLISLKL